ncbi:hypothetical protein EMCRGX_G005088 [Ephydatia muelleri]
MSHEIELIFDSSVSQDVQNCLRGFLRNMCDSAVTALQRQFQDYELDACHNLQGHHSAAYLIQADYSVTNIRIQCLSIHRSKLAISYGPQLKAQLQSLGSFKVAAQWHYQVMWGPQDKGDAEADVNDLSFDLDASLATEPPSFHVNAVQCTVGSVEFKFHGGALSAIYELFSHIISSKIKETLNSKLQEEASKLLQKYGMTSNSEEMHTKAP